MDITRPRRRSGTMLWMSVLVAPIWTTRENTTGARMAMDRRVGDLEDVEDIHGDVVGQVGKRSGHAEETDLSFVPKRLERLDGLVSLHLGSARRYVDL